MLSNKIITYGAVVIVVLAAFYVGNMVVNTTPHTGAKGSTQYKIVEAYDSSNVDRSLGIDQIYENQLNKYAADGWELVQEFGSDQMPKYILRKD